MFHIYAIYNKECDKFYIGQTDNLSNRLKLHNNKTFNDSYTSRFKGSWVIIYQETKQTREEALIREKQLKSYKGREFIKQYIPE